MVLINLCKFVLDKMADEANLGLVQNQLINKNMRLKAENVNSSSCSVNFLSRNKKHYLIW